MAYDRKKAEELVKKVLDKLDKSNGVYKDAYVLNDISREVEEELVDIVGWPLMEVLRIQEAMQKMIYNADNIYWEKFLKNQTTEFLQTLEEKVLGELLRRT
jgi:tetrahydromethanopterin S-methyltransferase subunit A